MPIGGVPSPTHDFPPVIDQPTQLDAHHPAMVRQSFPAHLGGAASFPPRVDGFNAIASDNREEGVVSQEGPGPGLVGPQQAGAMR